ncbi:hypothetical protein AMJ40_03135 [candidate division TA06 bacterium DG_26]|uniref:DUF2330 domain-containing protein n=1 Tax=candidate division TA06 bacterium DG_26 TaxID=1703771 RepID=A0A0S7WJQ8_UNCT6|nr:MAG: hypothetical protein AMJ40_03135 [candidate division TA06 bacterium DG_26]
MRYVLLFLPLASCAFGDGALFFPPGYPVTETDQIAVIKWENQREELIMRIKFEGDPSDFTWIVPTPTEPTVDSAGVGLFYGLSDFTKPIYKRRGWSCDDGGIYLFHPIGRGELSVDSSEVEIIGEGTVGVLAYQILRADDPLVLHRFLMDSGYHYPEGADSIFASYIDKNWFYWVAARVDTTQVSALYYGHLGIHLEFTTAEPVYPLRVSRLSSEGSSVTLYVVASHRMHFERAQLKFASRITAEDIQYMREHFYYGYEDLLDLLEESSFLTKLVRYVPEEDMDDITLRVAPDDREYREVIFYSGLPILPVLVIVRMMKRRKSGKAQ